ncbi:extracellular solute-binding protein, partial [Klebsiella pneumoniae]
MKKASKVFVLIFLTLVISLAACSSDSNSNGSDDENAGEVTTIYMAALENDPNGIIEKSRQEFNEAHDDIQVEFIKLSNNASEAHDQMVTQLAGGSKNLDIVNLDIVWIAEFAEAGWLLPLDDLFTEEMQS